MATNKHGHVPRHHLPASTIGPSDGGREVATERASSGTRAPRPPTRRQVPASADRELVVNPDDPFGPKVPYIDDESRDVTETLGGVRREPNYAADPTNPPDGPVPAKNLRGG